MPFPYINNNPLSGTRLRERLRTLFAAISGRTGVPSSKSSYIFLR